MTSLSRSSYHSVRHKSNYHRIAYHLGEKTDSGERTQPHRVTAHLEPTSTKCSRNSLSQLHNITSNLIHNSQHPCPPPRGPLSWFDCLTCGVTYSRHIPEVMRSHPHPFKESCITSLHACTRIPLKTLEYFQFAAVLIPPHTRSAFHTISSFYLVQAKAVITYTTSISISSYGDKPLYF